MASDYLAPSLYIIQIKPHIYMFKKLYFKLLSLWCKHSELEIKYTAKSKYKYKSSKSYTSRLRFDIVETCSCARCHKLIYERKIKSNLKQPQTEKFMTNL
jgi:hypothetical protein